MSIYKENLNFLFDLKYIKPVFFIIKSYMLVFILFASIVLTSIIHNDVVDTILTILTILNFFIVFRIIFLLYVKIIKSIFEICSP